MDVKVIELDFAKVKESKCTECGGLGWYISCANIVVNPCPICKGSGKDPRKVTAA